MRQVVLLTGARGVGKTGVCQAVVKEARKHGYCCSGLLSPCVFEGEEKRGIDLVDVSTGEARTLAVADDVGGEIRWGRYRFLPSTLEWATAALETATPCHLLVVDEVGPLEVEMGQGLVVALELLDGAAFTLALIVVRPELVTTLTERLKGAQPRVIEVTEQNRDALPSCVLSILHEELRSPDLPSHADGCIVAS